MQAQQQEHPLGEALRKPESGEDLLGAGAAEPRREPKGGIARQRRDDGWRVGANARREAPGKSGAREQREAVAGTRPVQQLFQLGADPLACNAAERIARCREGGAQGGVGDEAERRNEPRRSQRTQRILGEAIAGGSDRPQPALGEVRSSAPRIEEDRPSPDRRRSRRR